MEPTRARAHQLRALETAWRRAVTGVALLTALAGCSFIQPPARSVVYDFGPGATAIAPSNRMAPQPPLVLADVEAPSALDGTAVLYRLTYADAQQLRPYAQARWTMPPAQLLRQRLLEQLGTKRQVLAFGDTPGQQGIRALPHLRVELEEFSQLFDSPGSSSALVRVRATLSQSGGKALAQQTFVVLQPSDSADAPGGVRALAQATQALVAQLDAWLQQTTAAAAAP
jgi:cholesterol transport system auxiliary component